MYRHLLVPVDGTDLSTLVVGHGMEKRDARAELARELSGLADDERGQVRAVDGNE